jgi:hypothetical protein
MKVYAGTYQGSVAILQGDHTNLQLRATRNISEVDDTLLRTQSGLLPLPKTSCWWEAMTNS